MDSDLTSLSTDRLAALLDARNCDYEAAATKERHAREKVNAARRELSKAPHVRWELGKLVNAVLEEQRRRTRILDNIGR